MPTREYSVSPEDGWKIMYTATTNTNLSVEKINGGTAARMAIDVTTPTISRGHGLKTEELRTVELKAGEYLYIKCADDLSVAEFSITD